MIQLRWMSIIIGMVTYVAGNTWFITKHQETVLPLCSEDTVCSEISEMVWGKKEPHYFSWMMCKCPSGSECPKQPGEQTIAVSESKWYGMCQPTSEIGQCSQGEVAEDKFIAGREMFTRVHCMCPREELEEQSSGLLNSLWERKGQSVYKLVCGGEGIGAEKRRGGRYGGSSGRRFYFYKK